MSLSGHQKRVLLVDDHPVYRDGLKQLFNSHPQLTVVAEASNAPEALLKLQLCRPDLLVTDLRLGQSSGHDLIQEALTSFPELLVMVVSVNGQREEVLRAIQAGACAYLTKGASGQEIFAAVTEVLEGRSYLHAEVAHVVFQQMRTAKPQPEEATQHSPREQEVMELICQGFGPKEIGDQLCLSLSTVKTHLRNLYRKMGVNSRSQLILKIMGPTPSNPP